MIGDFRKHLDLVLVALGAVALYEMFIRHRRVL